MRIRRTAWRSISSPRRRRTPRRREPVMTGHDHGLITINLAEADDSERERMRRQMHEPYRTLLGHFRHEIAHYYWDRAGARHAGHRGVPAVVRRRARGLWRGAAAALQQRAAAGLAGALRHRLRQHASVGGLGGDLGALLPHGRHAGDRFGVRPAGPSARDQGRRPFDRLRLRSPQRGDGPHHRRLAAADLRGQLDQPQHGHGRSLSVRAGAAGDRQAVVHPRPHPCRRPGRSRRPTRSRGALAPSIAGLKRGGRRRRAQALVA